MTTTAHTPDASPRPGRTGVYVLANDRMLPWLRVFVASFRRFNPDLALCLIPFDDACTECERIVRAAGGEVYADAAAFRVLEDIGAALELGLTPYGPRWFRRYAAFDGPFDWFAYLDCRMAVLGDIAPFAAASRDYDVPFVHYDAALDQVYNDGPVRRNFCRVGRGHGFLSGLWATRRGLFTLGQMQEAGAALVRVRDQMNARNTDQFFINYLCDSHAVDACHIADLDGTLAHCSWAGDRGTIYMDDHGVWRRWDFGGLQHRKRLMLVHWAGYRLSPAMPNFHVYARFREPQAGLPTRAAEWVHGRVGRCLQRARGQRHLNSLYHRLCDRPKP